MNKDKIEKCDCGLEMVLLYFGFFAVNSLVIWLANIFFPSYVVLGTEWITKGWAIIHSMGTLALVNVFTAPCVQECETRGKKVLSSSERMGAYFVVNSVGLWLIARLAKQLGLGISSWLMVVMLGLVLSVVQREVVKWVKKNKKKCVILPGFKLGEES